MNIPAGVTRSFYTSVAKTKKNSPHIFFGAGLVGTMVSTYLACRATLKLEEWIDETQLILKETRRIVDEEPDNKALIRQRGLLVWQQLVKFGKLYGPAAGVHVLSVAALSGAHVQMARRNSALAATLGALYKAHEEYRGKVSDEIGEDEEKLVYMEACLVDRSDWNAFTRIFDEASSSYHKDAELNREFLHFIQEKANLQLRTRGIVYLNEVYEMLGFETTRMGSIYGWVYGGDGLNEIDFGIFEASNSRFINGLERAVVLNFNVDGPVSDFI